MDDGANMRDAWFYRDSKKREIGPVIQDGRTLHPIGVKASGLVGAGAVKNFKCPEGLDDCEVGFGQVVCHDRDMSGRGHRVIFRIVDRDGSF